MTRTIEAGPDGLKALDVFSPVRTDHLALAGGKVEAKAGVGFPGQGIMASLNPGEVYNSEELQFTPLTPLAEGQTYKHSGAHARLVWGKNVMLSILRMDPGSSRSLNTSTPRSN